LTTPRMTIEEICCAAGKEDSCREWRRR
jgi:hypothetical protein